MKTQDIFIAHPQTEEQVTALKAFMLALKIKFEVTQDEAYSPDFIAKIKKSQEQVKKGKITSVKKENLNEFLGL